MLIEEYISKCKVEMTNCTGEKMSDKDYFSIPAISNSRLRLLNPKEGGTPEKYQAGFQFGYNPSLLLGSAVHSQILNPDEIEVSNYEGKPSGKLGCFIEEVYRLRKAGYLLSDAFSLASKTSDYYYGHLTPKRLKKAINDGLDYYLKLIHGEFTNQNKEVLVLPKQYLDTCWKCVNAIKNQPQIHKLRSENLFEEKVFMNEYAFFADFLVTLPTGEEKYLKLKGKADSIIIDPEEKIIWLNDVKTTSKPIGIFMDHIWEGHVVDGSFSHHHYYTQMALYQLFIAWHLKKNLGYKDYDIRVSMWAVETTGDNKADFFPVNQAWLDLGKKELKELLVRVTFHEKYGWDKSFEDIITADL